MKILLLKRVQNDSLLESTGLYVLYVLYNLGVNMTWMRNLLKIRE